MPDRKDVVMDKNVYETTREAAEAIGASHATVADWIKSGRLKAERVPRGG